MTNTIYIGPMKLKDDLRRFKVYRDRPTELIDTLKEKYSLIELLFVPVDDLTLALDEVSTPGTARYKAYYQVKGGEN